MTCNAQICRAMLAGAITLASMNAHGQMEWEYSGSSDWPMSYAWSVREIDPDRYVTVIEEIIPGQMSFARHHFIGPDGLGDTVPIPTQPGWWHNGVGIYTDAINERRHLVGTVMDSNGMAGSQLGLFHAVTNLEFDTLFTALHSISPGARFVSGDIEQLSTGDLLYVVGMNTVNSPDIINQLLFLRLHSDGSPPDMRTYNGDFFNVRDVDEEPYGYRVTFQGEQGLGPPGIGAMLDFDHDFNYLSAVVMPNANGFPYQSGQDTILATYESERLPSGDLLVSCERMVVYTPLAPFQQRAFLAKISPTGQLLDAFDTPAPPPDIRSRVIRYSLRPTADGHYLWGYEENEENLDYSRVHLYKFNADLEVLGHILLDGNELDTHFEPRALVPTSDGGVLVCGAQDSLEDGIWAPHAYVAKFAGFTSLEEQAAAPVEVVAYPNPGRNLRLAVNGAILHQATVQLFDGTSRLVAQAPLQFNQAYLDTEALASGLYTYRLLTAQRGVVATGKWVRE
jgi:hypothetical protein